MSGADIRPILTASPRPRLKQEGGPQGGPGCLVNRRPTCPPKWRRDVTIDHFVIGG